MASKGAREKIAKSGPRKLLALDGGGIRGLITIEILDRIEKIVGKPLCEYFDYIAGTSTGAVIGTLLSKGKSAAEIRDIYLRLGDEMFKKSSILGRLQKKGKPLPEAVERLQKLDEPLDAGKYYAKRWLKREREAYSEYGDEKMIEELQELVGGQTCLDTDELRTLLLLILSNASTDSPWPVSNNPDAADFTANHAIPLWQLVRASTAAPLIFPPQVINVGGKDLVFVDGGLTSYNNPAFQLFMQATLKPYRLAWPVGEKQLLLVSIGTGLHPNEQPGLTPGDLDLIHAAKGATKALFNASIHQQDLLCRIFGKCLAGDPLDDELGDLVPKEADMDPAGLGKPLFTYVRYNATLTEKGLQSLELPRDCVDKWQQLQHTDSIAHKAELQQVGRSVAARKVKPEHFKDFPR